jgi:tetratricopeptide (TPR) repeat protein
MAETQPERTHASTRYQQVDEAVIEELQRTFTAGGDLYRAAPWISYQNKRIILAETLDADQLVGMTARRLSMEDPDVGPMTDFKRAALADMLLEAPLAAVGSSAGSPHEARALALLEEVATSPHASPLLAYEPLYRDLAESALLEDDPVALDWLRRALAHNLRYHKGDDVLFDLIDLASAYMQLGELDVGLTILTRLLHHDPGNIWIYRFIATGFQVLGLTALGLRGASRGMALLDESDDPEDLRDDFYMAQIELQTSPTKGREAEVSTEVLEAFDAALQLDFDAGQPRTVQELYDALVPAGDQVPVKAPLRFEDLPEEVRKRVEK